ncbi:MAG: DNA mismatch repair endonuclease MutL [Dissulfurispiraceae bacterium]|nr:DNA mismatch repair endonuclease MutL [Dissulfurispiraceae bacterium]
MGKAPVMLRMLKYQMPEIRILPEDLINKIAAGEVIERPASVVKELVENSLDSGATRIRVDISRAGKKMISVSDNGSGMDIEDASMAFERHATSKITSEEDLFNIRTNGFRGEALSSIAAVSRISLSTARPGSTGTKLQIEGSRILNIKDSASPGTTVEVSDLFYNTPARLKFLKSDVTENSHITETVTSAALANHHVGFELRIDSRELLSLPPASDIMERIVQIFGAETAESLFYSELNGIDMDLKIFAGAPAAARNTRAVQYVFVNSRSVKDQTVSYAVYQAYAESIPKGKHPVFFVFIDLPPMSVDFNVHPAKREVRFSDKSAVFNQVKKAVKNAISKTCLADEAENKYMSVHNTFNTSSEEANQGFYSAPQNIQTNIAECQKEYSAGMPYLYLGGTFVAVQHTEGLMIIDYHAAHERVNYERLLNSKLFDSIALLFPAQVQLRPSEYSVLMNSLDLLKEFGFDIEDFGNNTIIVRSYPDMLAVGDFGALMSDIAACISASDSTQGKGDIGLLSSVKKRLAARLACHSSIRGRSEAPDSLRIANLLRDLSETENPECCPHGRPATHIISISEMNRIFKR